MNNMNIKKEVHMNNRIDFGDIGIKIGDEIVFDKQPEIVFVVCSGNGTPGNGGTLIRPKHSTENLNSSIKYITKRLLGDRFTEDLDIFKLWSHKGETLRSIYLNK